MDVQTTSKSQDKAGSSAKPNYFWPFIVCLVLLAGMVGYHLGTMQRDDAYDQAPLVPMPVKRPDRALGTNRVIPNPHTSSPRLVKLEPIAPDAIHAEPEPVVSEIAAEKRREAIAMRPAIPGFTSYTQKLPGSTVSIDMVAIPGGEAVLGSPAGEPGRDSSDQPQHKAHVAPFWMGKYEITWEQFLPYVFLESSETIPSKDRLEGLLDKDGISHPTKPYGSVFRERGEKGYPALGMSLHAAEIYCRWLSQKTGQHYRLPTEDEWEYACRAGASAAFFWGADPSRAGEFGWSKENAADGSGRQTTHPAGKLAPNKFGLFDIVGNVGEWCQKTGEIEVLRGGSFMSDPIQLRSASRNLETAEWNELDPKSPKSAWWLSAADFAGFRIVRSQGE
jgi:formylglycine-generating enzyme required for sulfatase activity